jgi:hypothetical protein
MTSTEPETMTMCRTCGHGLLAVSSMANGQCERCRVDAGGEPVGFPERLAVMTDEEFAAWRRTARSAAVTSEQANTQRP